MRLDWNLCTSFAATGAGLAYTVLAAMFGFHGALLVPALAGLAAGYLISTALGRRFERTQFALAWALPAGVAAALATLIGGAGAIGVTAFSLELTASLARAPAGQPWGNAIAEIAPEVATSFLSPPLILGLVFGFLPCAILGLAYGAILQYRSQPAPVSRETTLRTGTAFALSALAVVGLVLVGAYLYSQRDQEAFRYHDVPFALRGCGSVRAPGGVLDYCRGSPCSKSACRWEENEDAFALYIRPPAGGWSWTGGGLGTARHPRDIVSHTYWVKKDPGGLFDEYNPHRHVRLRLTMHNGTLEIANMALPFEPGILIVVQLAEDWSVGTVGGHQALRGTGFGIATLQAVLDEACAADSACRAPFSIAAP